MKNTTRIVAVALVLVMALMAFAACGGNGGIKGKWTATQDGVTMTFEFKDGDEAKLSTMGVTMDATYKVDGDKLTVKAMGRTMIDGTFKVSGNTLSVTMNGETIDFKKA